MSVIVSSSWEEAFNKLQSEHAELIVQLSRCAAGPWQPGPPPKDTEQVFWLVAWGYLPIIIALNEDTSEWIDNNNHVIPENEIVKHSPINLPEE